MKPEDAIILDNFIVEPGRCTLRNGFQTWGTALGGPVLTLEEWAGGTVRRMLAGAGGKIWNVTAAGAGVSLGTGFSNNQWQSQQFMGRLFMLNGTDAPQDFDGTTLSATAWTGPSSINTLIQPNTYRNRLYMVESGTTRVWYGGVQAIQGALTSFDIASVAQLGGQIYFTATWSRDSGAGSAEYFVIVMDTGEMLVYTGAFPSDDSFQLVARFKIGTPLSRRAYCNYGPDLLILTFDGVVPFSELLQVGRDTPQIQISDKLGSAITNMINSYGVQFGWEVSLYPKGNLVIVNAPATSTNLQYQFVMQTVSQGWCRFVGMNANTFTTFADNLYFGGNDGNVYKALIGTADNGAIITGDMQTAFNYCGSRGINKNFKMIRPIIFTDGSISPGIDLETDFQSTNPTSMPSFSGSGGTLWDTALWDTFLWGGGLNLQSNWIGVTGLGYSCSIRMRVTTNSLQCIVQSFDIVFERGAFM